MKKHWKDRSGLGGITNVLLIILIIAVLGVAALLFTGVLADPTGGYNPPVKEGDDPEEHPIFAYFSISADVRFNNGEWFSGAVIYGLEALKVNTVGSAGENLQAAPMGELLDILNGHDCPYSLKFTIHGPTEANYNYPKTVDGTYYIGSGQNKVESVNMGATPGIRYEGWYQITVTLFDGEGETVSSLTKDYEVKK